MLTDPYLTHQLIPYIGNKRKLLPMIQAAVHATGVMSGCRSSFDCARPSTTAHPSTTLRVAGRGTFCDLFSGSGVVSRLAKRMGFAVISNDWEPYSEVMNHACVGTNVSPSFENLGGMEAAFRTLNDLEPVHGYIAAHYCPEDDERPDFERERMFYTQENGRRIDAIREQIERWKLSGAIDGTEEAVLLAPLIYQASYCSNTSGVFKGFHRGWGGATKTAWYRIRSALALTPPILFDNGLENIVTREDAAALAEQIECDIAYVDPPYNQHQYGSNYHLLNTVALWDKPPISRHITKGERMKSAIRLDWRTLRKSAYCRKPAALPAFSDLVARIRARFVLVSYSTDGIIPLEQLLSVLAERGKLSVITRRYKRYRVSSQRPSPRPHTVEFVAVVDTSATPRAGDVEQVAERIRTAGELGAGG